MRLLLFHFILFAPQALAQTGWLFGYEANDGSLPAEIRFVHRSGEKLEYITRDAIVLNNFIKIQIVGADPQSVPTGIFPSPIRHNLFLGNNPANWQTQASMFEAVRLSAIYPGAELLFGSAASDSSFSLTLTLEPGVDADRFHFAVLGLATTPFYGPGGVWFVGGRVPGVFSVRVRAVQLNDGQRIPLDASLKIESSEQLAVSLGPSRNPALSTQIVVSFPNHGFDKPGMLPAKSSDGNRYFRGNVRRPVNFDGDRFPGCDACLDAVIARVSDAGIPLWVSTIGGSNRDDITEATAAGGGVAISGQTRSEDFPVSANAPVAKLSGSSDVVLSFLNRDSGALLGATYAGLGDAYANRQVEASEGDLVVGGYQSGGGFLLRWKPAENRIVQKTIIEEQIVSLAADSAGIVYFAAAKYSLPRPLLRIGAMDARGLVPATPVMLSPPLAIWSDSTPINPQLLPAGGGEVWVAYQLYRRDLRNTGPPQAIAKVAPLRGQVLVSRLAASAGSLSSFALAPGGLLKLLIAGTAPTEVTSAGASLVAACPDTSYYLLLNESGQINYASYVPNLGFDFSSQSETPPPPATPRITCIASSAGRRPVPSPSPGQLVTITGAGFGPAEPIYASLGEDHDFPKSLAGFSARIGGIAAPIVAVARGLIAVQVPFEALGSFSNPLVELFDGATMIGTLNGAISFSPRSVSLFDLADRNNSLNLPVLAALNENGSVNSESNPARAGSIISVFGTGLGKLSPALATGAVSPNSPLSETSLLRSAYGGKILYLGSAPGLSTSVFQANVQLNPDSSSTTVRPFGVGIYVSDSQRNLFAFDPMGVVFIK